MAAAENPEGQDSAGTDVDGGQPPLRHPLEAVADRFVAHLFDEDFDELGRELFEPDFVRQDRSSLSFPDTDLAGFVEASRALGHVSSPRITRGPIRAVRRHCYLGSSTTTYEDGQENSRLVVLVAGATGRIARLITFDIDDLEAAEAELDRQDAVTRSTAWGRGEDPEAPTDR